MSKTAREIIFEYAHGFNWSDKPTNANEPDHLIAALDAAGFVIVPKEPTEKMLFAGEAGIDSDCKFECSPERVYRAMLAAAKGPP